MPDPRRILVVAGARALLRTPEARVWSLAQIATAMHTHRADVIVHGACKGSPDEWADELARQALLSRVRFPVGEAPTIIVHRDHAPVWAARPIAHAKIYVRSTPLDRNAAMALWASHVTVAAAGDFRALTLRCDWPLRDGERATQGTATARDRLVAALGAARVTDLVCPRELGPEVSRG